MNKIREELKEYFPYPVIHVDRAEADDVIGTLCYQFGSVLGDGAERILILSGDKDFAQLQRFSNIDQFDPVRKKKIKIGNAENFLLEHIIKGDPGDGIPNILSDDDVFIMTNKRQKPVTKKKMDEIKDKIAKNNLNGINRNYHRNKYIIDLSHVPNNIKETVLEQYNQQANKEKKSLMPYFMKYRLKNLLESMGDF